MTNSTLLTGFVAESGGRGTFGILNPCLAVLFLNTWTVFHINIPSRDESLGRRWAHRVKIWIITIIVPDGISTVAFNQWRQARHSVKTIQPLLPWWTIKHGFYAEMGGFRIIDQSNGQEYAFRSAQIAWLLKEKLIELPQVLDDELDDKSDADWIAKALACTQSAWFLLNSIARLVNHLPLTTLELEVLPFIATTWWTYFFWWRKPVNILLPTTVHVSHLPPVVLTQLANETCHPHRPLPWWRPVTGEIHERGWDFYWFEKPLKLTSKVESDSVEMHVLADVEKAICGTAAESKVAAWYRPAVNEMHSSEWLWLDDFVIYGLGVFINGVLLAAWNFTFATRIEAVLWRVSVLTMIASITLWWPLARLASLWLRPESMAKHIPFYVIIGLYTICRMYVIFEPFVGMRALPNDAYQTVTWSEYIAHIG
jgi:hypothetical protein